MYPFASPYAPEAKIDLYIIECDVVYEYLNAPCLENIWLAAGPEHGPEKTGKVMVMVRYSYWVNSSGAACRTMFAETLRSMDFMPTVADLDIYCRQTRKIIGEYYYELLLVYVNDVLCCLHDPQLKIHALYLTYALKDGLVGLPKIYLGSDIKKYQVRSGKSHWRMSST